MPDAPQTVISIRSLQKKFTNAAGERVTVLDDITFDIQRGETIVIMGGSGCGKSTLLNCLIGEYELDTGSVAYQLKDMPQPVNFIGLEE